jgi:hypothetical protein
VVLQWFTELRRWLVVLGLVVLFLAGSLAALYRLGAPADTTALAVGAAGALWFAAGAVAGGRHRPAVVVVGGLLATIVVLGLGHLWQVGDPVGGWWCLVAGDMAAGLMVAAGTAASAYPSLRGASAHFH